MKRIEDKVSQEKNFFLEDEMLDKNASIEKESVIEDQVADEKESRIYALNAHEFMFCPPYFREDRWEMSPMWIRRPDLSGEWSHEYPKDLDESGWALRVEFSDVGGRSQVRLNFDKGVDFYGGGLTMDDLRKNGSESILWATDNYKYARDQGRRLYQAHPWVIAMDRRGQALGILSDTTWRTTLRYEEHSLVIESEGPGFPVWMVKGKDIAEVLRALCERVGYAPMPPLWSLGYHQSRYSYETEERGLHIAGEFRRRRIPADVLWMDIDYMKGYRVFSFHPERFPDPREYSRELHALGFKGVWMIDPGVKLDPSDAVYKSGERNNVWVKDEKGTDFVGDVWPGACKFPDFTHDGVRKWWGDLYKPFMRNHEIDGIWNDMNEPAVFKIFGQTMPVDCHHRGDSVLPPGPHARYHNVYGMLMMQASREGMKRANPEKRPFLLSRSNFLGGHRYGATWTGDNLATKEHMKVSIPQCLNLGLSGQAFVGPDLGGFEQDTTASLWKKWTAFGVFYPFCRGHASKATKAKEPWAFNRKAEDHFRIAMERRYRLIPYFYTLFEENTRTGLPVMRPVFMADVTDRSLRREQEAFLLGADLLIVPPFSKKARLPRGAWRRVTLLDQDRDGERDQSDVYVRPGAIVPLGSLVQHTGEDMLGELTLIIVLDEEGRAEGSLYEDAGDGFSYKKGDYCRILWKAESLSDKIYISTEQISGKRESSIRQVTARLLMPEGGELVVTVPYGEMMVLNL